MLCIIFTCIVLKPSIVISLIESVFIVVATGVVTIVGLHDIATKLFRITCPLCKIFAVCRKHDLEGNYWSLWSNWISIVGKFDFLNRNRPWFSQVQNREEEFSGVQWCHPTFANCPDFTGTHNVVNWWFLGHLSF